MSRILLNFATVIDRRYSYSSGPRVNFGTLLDKLSRLFLHAAPKGTLRQLTDEDVPLQIEKSLLRAAFTPARL